MTPAAPWAPGVLVTWDLGRDRGTVQVEGADQVLPVEGAWCEAFTATPHVGQLVELELRNGAVVACRSRAARGE